MNKYHPLTYLTLLLIIIVSVSCFNSGSSNTFHVGISGQMKPYSYYDDKTNKPVGFDVDIANELARRLNKKLRITSYDFNRIILAVSNKQINLGMGSMNITEDRKKMINFTIPYNVSKGQIIVQSSYDDINTIDDLKEKGLKIGIRNGTVYPDLLKNNGFKNEQIKAFASQRDLRMAIQKGMIPAAISDQAAMFHLKDKESINIKFIGKPLCSTPAGLTVNKNNDAFLKEVNSALQSMIEDGTYEKIAIHWFGNNPLKDN